MSVTQNTQVFTKMTETCVRPWEQDMQTDAYPQVDDCREKCLIVTLKYMLKYFAEVGYAEDHNLITYYYKNMSTLNEVYEA